MWWVAKRKLAKLLHLSFFFGFSYHSLVADVVLDGMDASVQADSVLLDSDLLLNDGVDLLLEEVALIDIVLLELLVVFLEVGDVLDDLLEDVVGGLGRVVLKSCALASEQLDLFLVVVEKLDGFLRVSLQ